MNRKIISNQYSRRKFIHDLSLNAGMAALALNGVTLFSSCGDSKPDKEKDGITQAKALALMLKQPSMIKRPVLEASGGKLLVGFKPEQYAATVG